MEQFLNQIEVLGYKIDNAEDIIGVGTIPVTMIGGESSPLLPVTIVGSLGGESALNVFLAAPTAFNASLNCFLEAPTAFAGGMDVYTENYPEVVSLNMSMIGTSPSLDSLFRTVDVFITTESETVFSEEGGIDVTLLGPSSGWATDGINVTITNDEDVAKKVVDLTLWCEYIAATKGLKLHITGDGLYDGYIPYGGGMNCHIERLPGEMIRMFLQVVEDSAAGAVDVSMISAIESPDNLDISLPYVNDTLESGVECYTSGF